MTYFTSNQFENVIIILVKYALGSFSKVCFGSRIPPIKQVLIELTSHVVKAVNYFMANNRSNPTVIQIPWSIDAEKTTLKDTSRKYYKKSTGGGQNLERRNVKRLIFRNFKIANIEITNDELFNNFIFEFNFSFFRIHLNSQNI